MVVQTLFKNRYRLLDELGKGGMGIVYRAYDSLLERDVAVKILSSTDLGSESRLRLLHEAQAAAKLNHPNIVSIYDAGEEDDQSFIIMELLEGSSLYDCEPETIEEIIAIARQICNALEHAHTHGIIHRDLKPENVIVDQKGQVKLTDFGLARSITSRISVEGAIIGTVFYMAPEQALGQPIDRRTDLYALGALLYELITGRLPFSADDPLAVISQHLYAPIIPPSNYKPDIPPALDSLILRLLSKRPEDRPESASVVRLGLDPEALNIDISTKDRSDLDALVRGRLVGREDELTQAKQLWRQAAFGNAEKSVLLISGEPGIGKTPLVREIKAFIEITGGKTLTGVCYEEGSAPYAPILDIIREGLQVPGVQLHDFVLADLIMIAPDLRSRYPQVPINQILDPITDQQRLFESITSLIIELSSRTPLLIVVEDIQWADGGTLALLRHLARRKKSSQLSMMIVATYREIELETVGKLAGFMFDLNRENLVERIKLCRYDKDETRELLNIMFQEEVSQDFLEDIYRETEGNLYFIEEMCKALIEQGKLHRQDNRWRYSSLDNIQLPQSVRFTIQGRVNKLPQTTQNVLTVAAVIGRKFEFNTLWKACDLDEEALIEALENAQKVQLIQEVESDQSGRLPERDEIFIFAHGLIATTLRESLSSMRRHRLHRQVAGAIESLRPDDYAALAYHYEKAQDPDQACQYYIKAGSQAIAVYANQEAEKYFRAAESLTSDESRQMQLLTGIGESLFRQSMYNEAIQSWKTAIEIARNQKEHDRLAILFSRTARAAWYAGDVPGGLTLCLEGMEFVPENYFSPGTAALIHETARAYFFNKKPDEALPLCHRALEMAERLDLPEVQAETLATLGVLPNQTFEEKKHHLMKAIEIAEGEHLWATAARAHLNMGGQLQEFGEMQTARAHFLNAYEFARKMGNFSWTHDFLAAACETSMDLGDFDYVEETLPILHSFLDSIPNRDTSALYDHLLEAQLYSLKGEWEKSLALIKEQEYAVTNSSDQGIKSRSGIINANSLLEIGNPKEAKQLLHQIIYDPDGNVIEEYIPVASSLLTRAYILMNEVVSAEQLVRLIEETDTHIDNNLRKVHVLFTQALVASARGKYDEAIIYYQKLLDLVDKYHLRWTQGLAYLRISETLTNRGKPDDHSEARSYIERAVRLFQEINAPGYEELAKQNMQLLDST
jgi:tetratricopeptide (TPR) repeat protein